MARTKRAREENGAEREFRNCKIVKVNSDGEFRPNPFVYDDGDWTPQDRFGIFDTDGAIYRTGYYKDAAILWASTISRFIQPWHLARSLWLIVFDYWSSHDDPKDQDIYEPEWKDAGENDGEDDFSDASDDDVPFEFRFRPGNFAMNEIARFQNSSDLLMPRIPLQRVCLEILSDVSETVTSIDEEAMCLLHLASEDFLVEKFQEAYKRSIACKRISLLPEDMRPSSPLVAYRKSEDEDSDSVRGYEIDHPAPTSRRRI